MLMALDPPRNRWKTRRVTPCVMHANMKLLHSDAEGSIMNIVIRDKAEYHAQTTKRMEKHFVVPEWTVRQKLALACRMLAADGHDSGLAGQLSARADKPGAYYMLQFGLGLEEITAENLLLVDDDLNVLEGDGMPNPSNRFHLWIYRAKPHVNSIMHTHSPYVSALSMIGVPLAVAHMDTSL